MTFATLMVLAVSLDGGQAGALDQEVIKREIRTHHEHTWACYERTLGPESVTDFRVALTVSIAPSGHVESVQAKSSSAQPEVESCLIAEAKTWHFPKSKSGAKNVRYPFIFKADED